MSWLEVLIWGCVWVLSALWLGTVINILMRR